jgi:hypothetical protein
MNLNEYAATARLKILSELQAGLSPSQGTYSEERLKDARSKGRSPQMGTTRYEPNAIHFEFIYQDPQGAPVVLSVHLDAPERIVFMPVPSWVLESIWQGDISGSPHFESDANRLLEEFRELLTPETNAELFGERARVGRDG